MVAVTGEQAHTSDPVVVRLEIVDIGRVGAGEPPFVSEQRHELVDRLLAEFDRVCQSGTPQWWSIEGHSGWGKTRLIQELYRRLAAERQSGAEYWPLSFLPEASIAKNAGPLMSMRKRVYPEQVVREHEAVRSGSGGGSRAQHEAALRFRRLLMT